METQEKNVRSLEEVLSSMGMTWFHKPPLLSPEALAAGEGAPYPSSPILSGRQIIVS